MRMNSQQILGSERSTGSLEAYAVKNVVKDLGNFIVKIRISRKNRNDYQRSDSAVYEVVNSVEDAYLLGVYYSGELNKAYMKLYSEKSGKIYIVYDPVGHKPYFLTEISPEELSGNKRLVKHPSFEAFELVEKLDLLRMKKVKLTKVVTKDPLTVRELRGYVDKAYEAKIKYHHNYVYDLLLIPGMRYSISNGRVVRSKTQISEESAVLLSKLTEGYPPEKKSYFMEFAELFEEKPPELKILAVDVEVYTPIETRIPNPEEAHYPVISVALVSSDGLKKVLVLSRQTEFGNLSAIPENCVIEFFDDERSLIMELFRVIGLYHVIVTFNGDIFDLQYVINRALTLGIDRSDIPFDVVDDYITLRHGFHIDLYRFFSIEAIQNYAFGSTYKEKTLDSVSRALLGESKLEIEVGVSSLPICDLIRYNLRDAELTLKLLTRNNMLVWKLVILMMRISKMGIEEVTRKAVSAWIKSLLFWEHRRRGYLIPESSDIIALKGEVKTASKLGKKFAGAIVIDPIPGVYFNVTVLDFASLYPSIMVVWNLSYETIDPQQGTCRRLADVKDESGRIIHRVCMDYEGITSQTISILREFRVKVYKKLAKDRSLSEELRNWYDIVQSAMKVFINASYGVFGHREFPFFSPALAESVTAIGRHVITSTLELASKHGLRVLYGDTDSLFVWNPERSALDNLVKEVSEKFKLEIEVDKTYRYVVFALKKNYIGVKEDGNADVKGFTGKKRNTPEIVKNVFNYVVEAMKTIEPAIDSVEDIKKKVRESVGSLYIKLKNRDLSLEDVTYSVELGKNLDEYDSEGAHVKAAKMLLAYNRQVRPGDVIYLIKVRSKEKVKPIQLARIDEIDIGEYMSIARSTLEQLLTPLNISWDEIAGSISQDLYTYTKGVHNNSQT
ncbi:MAG: DNA-directed DNA polymerase I [Sulfolobales archaeon]|nr:DNA-directed DNA polymerase I [Sulfolobales archaeon]MDW8083420.1 DNA-directed DNA polymerase I [Sulfolobales archaeon]